MGRSRRPFPHASEVAFQRIANSGPAAFPHRSSSNVGLGGQTARSFGERRVSSFTPPSTGRARSSGEKARSASRRRYIAALWSRIRKAVRFQQSGIRLADTSKTDEKLSER